MTIEAVSTGLSGVSQPMDKPPGVSQSVTASGRPFLQAGLVGTSRIRPGWGAPEGTGTASRAA